MSKRKPTLYIVEPLVAASDLKPRMVTAWREDSAFAFAASTTFAVRRATPVEAATLAAQGVAIEDATTDQSDSAGA